MNFDLESTVHRLDWLQERLEHQGKDVTLENAYQRNIDLLVHYGYILEADPYRDWYAVFKKSTTI